MKFSFIAVRRGIAMLICLSLTVTLSCQKDKVVDVTPNQKLNLSDPTLKYILSLGFSKDKVVDYGEFYAVEGDIAFEKQQRSDPNARPFQFANFTSPLIDYDYFTNPNNTIRIRIGDIPDDAWRNEMIAATQAAIGNWNTISNKKYRFSYTTSLSADVTVYSSNIGSFYALSSFPNCAVGSSIRISPSTNNLTPDQQTFVMTHELGHILGLRHTDDTASDLYLIQGTNSSDPESIMNTYGPASRTSSPPSSNNFTNNDIIAVRTLYPTTAAANSKYNGTTDKIETIWTTSYFCDLNVTIQVKQPNGYYLPAVTVANKGIYSFEPVSPGIYTVFVSNSSRSLTGTADFQ